MAKMKNALRKLAEMLPFALTKNLAYDKQTLRVMKRVLKPESNCLDIGCHKGEVLRHMLHFAPKGQHHGFEPLPAFYEQLQKQFPANCTFHNVALSNATGSVSFQHVVSNPAYSGIKQREYARDNEEIAQIEVKTIPLDELLPKDYPVDFVKIDVEGAEMLVLEGAQQTMKRWKPIVVFEHGLGAADHYDTTPEQVADYFHSLGFKLNTMQRWLRKKPALEKAAFAERFYQQQDYYFMAYPQDASSSESGNG